MAAGKVWGAGQVCGRRTLRGPSGHSCMEWQGAEPRASSVGGEKVAGKINRKKRDTIGLEAPGEEVQDGAQASDVNDWVASVTPLGTLTVRGAMMSSGLGALGCLAVTASQDTDLIGCVRPGATLAGIIVTSYAELDLPLRR